MDRDVWGATKSQCVQSITRWITGQDIRTNGGLI
jgi:hypothetical protein